jgi:hypothetical protein
MVCFISGILEKQQHAMPQSDREKPVEANRPTTKVTASVSDINFLINIIAEIPE